MLSDGEQHGAEIVLNRWGACLVPINHTRHEVTHFYRALEGRMRVRPMWVSRLFLWEKGTNSQEWQPYCVPKTLHAFPM